MDHGFGIDTAFGEAVARWMSAVSGEAIEVVTLRGEAGALLPALLEIQTSQGTIEVDVGDWPHDLPRSRAALREDSRVWELFATEWSIDEIRVYLDLDASVDVADVRRRFVQSSWWQEFELMVAEAFMYEWRAALENLARPHGARAVVARPTPDEASLREFEDRLNHAASRFEASTFDARLLYDESARKAAFLIHTSDAEE